MPAPWEFYQTLKAFTGQESGGNPNARSVQDARGTLQITKPLFDRYSAGVESFDNPADVNAVAFRAFKNAYERNNGDPTRLATEWFSGAGNVDRENAIPWKRNTRDANGQDVAGYVAGILGRLNPIGTAHAAETGGATPPWELDWASGETNGPKPWEMQWAAPETPQDTAQPEVAPWQMQWGIDIPGLSGNSFTEPARGAPEPSTRVTPYAPATLGGLSGMNFVEPQ